MVASPGGRTKRGHVGRALGLKLLFCILNEHDSKIPSLWQFSHFGRDLPRVSGFCICGSLHTHHSILVAVELEYYIIWNKDLGEHPTKTICFKLQIQQNNGCYFCSHTISTPCNATPREIHRVLHVRRLAFEERQKPFPPSQWKRGLYLELTLTPVAFWEANCQLGWLGCLFDTRKKKKPKSCSFCLKKCRFLF